MSFLTVKGADGRRWAVEFSGAHHVTVGSVELSGTELKTAI